MPESDVLILGAGPAGTAAAICCAQSGLRVVVAERAEFPRHRPGETLHPGIEPLLRQLGAWDALGAGDWLRHAGHWTQQGDEAARFEAFGSDAGGAWRGFQVERGAFDALLLRQAQRLGAHIIQPCQILEAICEKGRVRGVKTSAGTLQARFLVDATGTARWLARKIELAVTVASPCLRVRYGYLTGDCPDRNEAPLWAANETGWTWTARVRPHVYHWTRLWLDAQAERLAPRDWLPREFEALTRQGRTRGMDVTWRNVTVPAGSGYFLAGDAAFLLDPASSHGVLKALMSGMMAAHTIAKIVRRDLSEADAQQAYTLWLHHWFATDAAKLAATYASLRT